MSKLTLCSAHDKIANVFLPTFSSRSKAEAIRIFAAEANSSESQIGKYPNDFDLYFISEFDQDTGEMSTGEKQLLIRASETVEAK